MEFMNNRQKELLRILLTEADKPLVIQDLSERVACSEKTIRNDLNDIEAYLKQYKTAVIIRKPGIGVYLKIDEAERTKLFQSLHQTEVLSEQERLTEIAYQLLVSEKPITQQQLADQYYVNKAAIKQDLASLTSWLRNFDLSLVSRQRIGNTIEGTELNKRSALAHVSQLYSPETKDTHDVLDLFLPHEISTVRKTLKDLQQHYDFIFIDGAFESLLVHALIMIKRTRQQINVFIDEGEKDAIYQREDYQHTRWFLERLEHILGIRFPEEEVIYFTWHLISCKKRQGDTEELANQRDLEKIVSELTVKLRELTLINFQEDTVLIDGLTIHMDSVVNRLTYGFPITNPLLSEIKKMYPYMFGMVLLAVKELKSFAIQMPEDEAAYLVLHFQASIERMQGVRERKKQGIIVCHMGVGMSHLLQAKLEQNFYNVTILACIGKAELRGYLKENKVDFIISTIPLGQTEVPSIVVSPLLEQKEKEKVGKFIKEVESGRTNENKVSPLVSMVEKETVFLQVEKEHRYEVVEMLANALYVHGYVDQTYTHSALLREKLSATSIGSGIAIPHGKPEGIKKPAIAVAVLAHPLEWGNEMVSLVFLLAISNEHKKQAGNIFHELSSLSEQPSLVESLQSAQDPSEFIMTLHQ